MHAELAVGAERLRILGLEGVLILGGKGLTPSLGVAPVTGLEVVPHVFIDDDALAGIAIVPELLVVDGFELVGHLSDFEIRLSHLQFFLMNERLVDLVRVVPGELLVGERPLAVIGLPGGALG